MLLDQQITVAQLIAKLQNYPPNDIIAHFDDGMFVKPIELVYHITDHGQHYVGID